MNKMKTDTVFVASSKEKPIVTGVKKWIRDYNSQVSKYKLFTQYGEKSAIKNRQSTLLLEQNE